MTQNSLTLPVHLQQMKFEMELRGLSPQTLQHYLTHLRLLEKYFNKPASQVSPNEIKEYLYFRIKSGLSYSNINISCNAFKLFFNKVLKYNWSDNVIVRPKRPKKLPCVLSKDEILSIIDQVDNLDSGSDSCAVSAQITEKGLYDFMGCCSLSAVFTIFIYV
ncbi:hypothetical protein JCM15765_19510 [Paradesulfitobacterium aromaticivorans]